MDKRSFGQALAAKREAHGMSAEGLAAALGVPYEEYAAIERGEKEATLEFAKSCVDAFGVSLDELTSYTYVPKLRMGAEDGITAKDLESAATERENEEIRRYNRGRTIMQVILILEVISLVLSLFTSSLLATIFKIVMLVCLWKGHTWARTVYVLLTAIGTLLIFAVTGQLFDTHIILGLFALANVAWGIVVCVLLLASKSVEEFLYEQSTSR